MKIKNARFESTLESIRKTNVLKRLWKKDPSLWKTDPVVQSKIQKRLGWLTLPTDMEKEIKTINDFVSQVREEGFTQAVLLGMGGSSLCPEVSRLTYGTKKSYLKLFVLDTTDPGAVLEVESKINLKKTLFIVSSKSGGTIEVHSLYRYFYDKVEAFCKSDKTSKQTLNKRPDSADETLAGKHFVAITDPNTPLEKIAKEKSFRKIFSTPEDVGGRYSALTFFGLVPAALMGVDMKTFLNRAKAMMTGCGAHASFDSNAALHLGVALGVLGRAGRDKVTFVLSPEIASLGMWLEQLMAESIGKEEKGLVPIEGEDLLSPDNYGSDRVFVSIQISQSKSPSIESKLNALVAAGHPVIYIKLKDIFDLAGEFLRWELAVAIAGIIYGINPFDEPNVAESKANTNKILAQFEASKFLPEDTPQLESKGIRLWADSQMSCSDSLADTLAAHLARVKAGDYIALMAYLTPNALNQRALRKLRQVLRVVKQSATTVGYGPRFLHSTGQLHKGGDNNGVFLQITAKDRKNLVIPGVKYGFSNLKMAQALGDFQALKEHGRRVVRLHLTAQVLEDLERITKLLGQQKGTSVGARK